MFTYLCIVNGIVSNEILGWLEFKVLLLICLVVSQGLTIKMFTYLVFILNPAWKGISEGENPDISTTML